MMMAACHQTIRYPDDDGIPIWTDSIGLPSNHAERFLAFHFHGNQHRQWTGRSRSYWSLSLNKADALAIPRMF
jgi:hypothetical protein